MNVMRNGVRANALSARAARVWRGFNRLWLKVRSAQAKAQPAENMGPLPALGGASAPAAGASAAAANNLLMLLQSTRGGTTRP